MSVGRVQSKVDFSRGRAVESLMRFMKRVIEQASVKSLRHVSRRPRSSCSQQQHILQSSPESFNDRYRSGLANRSVALLDSQALERRPEVLRSELRALVGDEVLRLAVLLCSGSNQIGHFNRGRFFEEQLRGKGEAREDIEQDYKLECEQLEGAGDVRDVHHPDVIGRLRLQDSIGGLRFRLGLGLSRLVPITANCFFAQLDAGASELCAIRLQPPKPI